MAEVGTTAYWQGERVTPSVAVGKAHALFGEVVFDLITYFDGAEYKFGAEYAQHALMGSKPRLQFVGDKLDEISWRLVFHHVYCQPEKELLKLRSAIAKHQAMPLVFANGDFKGWFVPVDVSVTATQTAVDGTLLAIEAQMNLLEFVPPKTPAEAPAKKPAQAAEKRSVGKTNKPARTVKRKPTPRAKNAKVTR